MDDKLDLAFAMDCTGSMGRRIESAKQNIENIMQRISSSGTSKIRFGLVEYRDHPPQDKSFITRKHDFTPDLSTMKSWLTDCSADGGGDTPEAVADALYDVLHLSWRSDATKICVLISDAPPHGLTQSDNFPQCPAGHDPVCITFELAKKGVVLYSVGCGLSGNVMEFFMAIAFKAGGQYVPLSNASNLAEVIIGGAQEEVSLEKWMTEVDEEVQRDLEAGTKIDEEELSRRIHEKMKLKGARAKQLKRNKQVGEITRRAKMMSKLQTLHEMRDFPAEGSYLSDPDIDFLKAGTEKIDIDEGEITDDQSERMTKKSLARMK
nr:alpha-protein kinase vwkA-like [Crassostrea gigas]